MISRLTALLLTGGLLAAQAPNPTQQATTVPASSGETPLFRMTVVGRSTKAINYRHRGGATKIDFRGTPLLPESRGEAKVESKQGYIEIEVEFDDLQPASRFGPEYLTYVMWAITPEGRATNLGEVLLNGTKSKLNVTTELQAFGLIITAEPYFAVTQPSDVVVMENVVRPDTRGKVEMVDAKYELLQRGSYTSQVNPADLKPLPLDKRTPLELYEARNAIRLARWGNADRYAQDTFQKADRLLQQAEDYQARKAGQKPVIMTAREAVQTAEDARAIALRRMEEERLAQERQAAADREARAKADAEESDRQRRVAEERQRLEAERRARADADRLAAERAKREADLAAQRSAEEAARAARATQEAEAARAAALAQQQALAAEAEKARLAAAEADRLRQQAENDKTQLRQQLLEQFNRILETRDTARGLIVNMSDVLFDFNKFTLRPAAREKLAKITGIALAHPGLRFDVEGHTDSVGSDDYNQTLSEKRAQSVQQYLTQQGLPSGNVTARGFGESQPVASNDTAAGRQQNRRVELVVSGEVIGSQITGGQPSNVAPPVPRP
jgi:outer membrane protein OmpA-like peptidoglycan-associated protein